MYVRLSVFKKKAAFKSRNVEAIAETILSDVCISADTPVREVAKRLTEDQAPDKLIVTSDGNPIGALDISDISPDAVINNMRVRDLTLEKVNIVSKDESLEKVYPTLKNNQAVVVRDGDIIRGIATMESYARKELNLKA